MDVVTLVTEGVKEQLHEWSLSDDANLRGHAKDCNATLVLWRKQARPLAYMDNAYSNLVRAINNDPATLGQGLPASYHGQKSLSWFAEQCLDAVVSHGTRTLPPFWKTGHSFAVFKMGIKEAERILGARVDDSANRTALINFITKAASLAKICNVP